VGGDVGVRLGGALGHDAEATERGRGSRGSFRYSVRAAGL
jgi:hypothetical protein